MAMFTVTVTPDNEPEYQLEIQSRDVLNWERTSKSKRTFNDFMGDVSVADMFHMAHLAAWRAGKTELSRKDFEDQHDVKFASWEDEPDPTPPARSADTSSPSPSEPGSRRASGRKKETEQ